MTVDVGVSRITVEDPEFSDLEVDKQILEELSSSLLFKFFLSHSSEDFLFFGRVKATGFRSLESPRP
jgi:hypothetical protein